MERKFGLKPVKKDFRDKNHHATFGTLPLSQLPENYVLESVVLNQNGEKCTAYSACAVRASMLGKEMDAEDFWNKEAIIAGSYSAEGYDLKIPMKTGVKLGFNGLDGTENKANVYLSVKDDVYDLFDDIRVAIWQGVDEKRTIETGVKWRMIWDDAKDGIIPSIDDKNFLGGHAIKIAGWKTINGVCYLIVQNSWGLSAPGSFNGLYYFPREVVNRDFTFGNFYFTDQITKEQAQAYSQILAWMSQILHSMLDWLKGKNGIVPPPPNPILPPQPTYLWDNATNSRHSVRVICDEEGLPVSQKNELCATIACETKGTFDPKIIHKNDNGTTDFGICQINDYWNIGTGKPFPSSDYVLTHPEECVRWMCKKWKQGQQYLWSCYRFNLYKDYL